MRAVLFTALALAGVALSAPWPLRRAAAVGKCATKSPALSSWTVTSFDFNASYTFSTPAHQIAGGYVSFTLGNAALDYKPVCSASSDQLEDFFYGNFMYQCDIPVQGDNATFTFSRPDNTLRVNQTWTCDDAGEQFIGQGGVQLDLNCTDKSWQNPDWHAGEIYSTRNIACNKVTVPAPIETLLVSL